MPSDSGLARYIAGWTPSDVDGRDVISAQRVRELSASLDCSDVPAEGDVLPPLWHWVFFLMWAPKAELASGGHPLAGDFLPPLPNRRRMFAGGRIAINGGLVIGEEATRRSVIVNKVVKSGRTGELLFVTIRHTYHQQGEVRITEEQDLVYRSDTDHTTSYTPVTEPLAPPTMPWFSTPLTTAMLLFRFSALTGNAHRIHYDEPYATHVEGFPALVVHGPLLAVYMAELMRAHVGPIMTFDFRLTRPVFLADAIRVQGGTDGRGSASLSVVSGNGTVHATATATPA